MVEYAASREIGRVAKKRVTFSGRELAKALMTKSGELVWRKGFFGGMSAVTRAVKAAVEAQEALSEALGKFNESLAGNDKVDAKMQESFTELQFQCDRRATEIYSVVVRMHDLAQQDAVSGVIDEQVMEYLDATFKDNPLMKHFSEATQTMLNLFEQFETGARPMDEFDDAFDTCKSRFPDEDMLRIAMQQVGFDSAVASNFSIKTIRVLDVVAAQFKELMRHGENLKASDAESMVMADDVRRIMLGEAKLSVYVEAKSRGFKPDDVDPRTDTSNIAKSEVLGSGIASTTYLLTTHSGEELVFKPELDSRFGLHELNLGKGGAYLDSQKTANLNLATQQTAKTFGCEDIIVKYSVGVHDGQFGCFMEKAKGFSGKQFVNRADEGNGGIAPASLRLAIGNTVERTNIQGKIAQKLNKLMWLDLITGQGDRHWDNYFINIDKTSHEVTLKAIDNDASFSAIRIGLQKIEKSDHTTTVLRQNPQGTGIVNDYLETSTPSFYKREFFNQMFG